MLFTPIVKLWASIILLENDNPIPLPWLLVMWFLDWKKRSNTFSMSFSGIPIPVSITSTFKLTPSKYIFNTTASPLFVNFKALLSKLFIDLESR